MKALSLAGILVLSVIGAARADPPRVVASIVPVHAIVAAVMAGVAVPALVVKGGGSPHAYALRPSDARALARANLVFWIGEGLETFLAKPLAALAGTARVVTLTDAEGIRHLPVRAGGAWEQRTEDDAGGEPGHATDPHVWLDPANAVAIARAAAAALAGADPDNRAIYAANAERFAARADALDAEIEAFLAPVRTTPYAVFHDAFQHFERRYRLNAVGAVTAGPQQQPSAKRIQWIGERIETLGARCLFREPQFAPALAETIARDVNARTGVLDPLGAALEPGPDAYFALMRGLARALRDCLTAGK